MNRLSEKGADLLKSIEELRLEPYDDQTGEKIDRWSFWMNGATIGYGHLISQDEWDKHRNGITKEGADMLFFRDLDSFERGVNRMVERKLYQQEFDALVILAFNIGLGNFSRSSVRKLVNDDEASTPYASLEDAWKAWNRSQGKIMKGLINRREAEYKIFTEGEYVRW